MKKFIMILFLILFNTIFILSLEKIDCTTILIIIEEKENNKFLNESTPISDGIFNALWDKDFIFFDMKIDKPINVVFNQLDIKPYINIAKGSGADSVLLLKIHYFTEKNGKKLKINCKDTQYNFYSLNSMKSIVNGTIESKLDELVDNSNDKNALLKKTGFNILNEIFNNIQ